MGMFRYEAVDKTGKVMRGVMNASDEQQVAQKLTQMGYAPSGIYPASGGHRSSAPASNLMASNSPKQTGGINVVTVASGVPVSVRSKVPPATLAMLFRQLATLVKAGRPLNQSMTEVAVRNSIIRETLPQIQNSIQSGQKLSGAMAAFPYIYPVHVISSIWSGELDGRLDVALDEIASDYEQEASDIRISKIGWGITKITLISFIIMVPAFDLNSLMPAAMQSFNNPSMNWVAVLGEMAKDFAHTFITQSLLISLAFIASWIIWGNMKRIPTVKRILDGLLLRVPVWGPMHRFQSLSRFLHVLDGLTAAGINLSSAWDAASLTPRNSEIAEKLKLAKNYVSSNDGVSKMFEASGVFEPDDIGMALAGERAGDIPNVLGNLSQMYEGRYSSAKTVGRAWSITAFTTFLIATTGYLIITLAKSYADLLDKIPKILSS